MKYAFLSLVLACSLFGQEAKVVPLSKADADRAKVAYDAMKKAEADWQAVQADIEHKYVSDAREDVDYGGSGALSTGSSTISGATAIIWNGHEFAAGGTNPCYADAADDLCLAYKRIQQERKDKSDREEKERLAKLPKKTVYTPKDGWRNGFEFSHDFQFIVPKPEPVTPGMLWRGTTGVAVPAIGTYSTIN